MHACKDALESLEWNSEAESKMNIFVSKNVQRSVMD